MSVSRKQDIFAAADEIGFTLMGVAEPKIVRSESVIDWLGRGYAGSMAYMYRNLDKRLDPRKLVPGVRSILCLGVNYYQRLPETILPAKVNVSLYAWGGDYHVVIREMLHRLAGRIKDVVGRDFSYRVFVDSAPVLEKNLAEQAGLGWIGKNACLLNRRWGSYFFLGEIFLDFELDADEPAKNYCGRCTRCLDACPTGAVVEAGRVDARRCISYLTIEHDGAIDSELAARMDHYVYGCDRCQAVCPFNRFAKETAISAFRSHVLGPVVEPQEILKWDESAHAARTAGSAAGRASLDRWRRNAKIVHTS